MSRASKFLTALGFLGLFLSTSARANLPGAAGPAASAPVSAVRLIYYYQCDNGIWFSLFAADGSVSWSPHFESMPEFARERSVKAVRPAVSFTQENRAKLQQLSARLDLQVEGNPVPCRRLADVPEALVPETMNLADKGKQIPSAPFVKVSAFDESFRQSSIPFVSQEGKNLVDRFSKIGHSQLCGPAALAQQLLFLRASFPNVQVVDDSGRDLLASAKADASPLVQRLADLCGNDVETGTYASTLAGCASYLLTRQNAKAGSFFSDLAQPDQIREYLQKGYGMVLLITFFSMDEHGKVVKATGGHFVSVVGYDYDKSWGNRRISLQVVNSEAVTSAQNGSARPDQIWLIRGDHLTNSGASSALVVYGKGFNNFEAAGGRHRDVADRVSSLKALEKRPRPNSPGSSSS